MSETIHYFLFSRSQLDMRIEMEKKMGKKFKPGEVIVNGIKKQYTEIVTNPKNSRYSDAVVVTYGNKNNIKYYDPISV